MNYDNIVSIDMTQAEKMIERYKDKKKDNSMFGDLIDGIFDDFLSKMWLSVLENVIDEEFKELDEKFKEIEKEQEELDKLFEEGLGS